MPKQFKTVEFEDRKKIASMYADGAIAAEIARKITEDVSAIELDLTAETQSGAKEFTLAIGASN